MARRRQILRPRMPIDNGKRVSELPPDRGFHFHLDVGNYTGQYATNLNQFSRILKEIDLKSIEFHNPRGDFENWIRFIGDDLLSNRLVKIRGRNVAGEALRSEIVRSVRRRLQQLTNSKSRLNKGR